MSIQNWRVKCKIQHFTLLPIKFKNHDLSFQWAKTWVEILGKKLEPKKKRKKQHKKPLELTSFEMSYDIPARNRAEALRIGKATLERWMNLAALLFDDGMQIVGPISMINFDTGEKIEFEEDMELKVDKENYYDKRMILQWPRSATTISSDCILTYTRTTLIRKPQFFEKISEINEVIKFKLSDAKETEKVDYAMKLYRQALQITDFTTRFLLYWRAFEVIITPRFKKGLVSKETQRKMRELLKLENIGQEDILRAMSQIKSIDRKPKSLVRAVELSKFVDEDVEELRKLILHLEKKRGKIVHTAYIERNIDLFWYDCEQLRLLLKQIIRTKIGWEKTRLERPKLVPGIQIFEERIPVVTPNWSFRTGFEITGEQ